MKNNIKKIGIGLGVIAILLGGRGVFSEVGTDRDPLITKSYVDKKINEIKSYLDIKISNTNTSANEFIVVDVAKGKSIVLGGGSEAILRSGQAKCVSKIAEDGTDNGLADVTAGKDLKMDELITLNHLLLTPRDDGRGASAISDSIFLVRGNYEIK